MYFCKACEFMIVEFIKDLQNNCSWLLYIITYSLIKLQYTLHVL